jgi:hypothetical protein
MLTRAFVACAAAAALVSAACDKVPLTAPTNSTISVSADAQVLPPGGNTRVSALVIEAAGTPVHDGTVVRFTATLGQVNPVEVETRGGVATTTFVAGSESGTAQIRATSGAANGGSGDSATNVVEIQVGAAAAQSVAVSASPSRVPSSGGTVTIVASAMDASGNRLVGVPITFTSTAGTLSASSAATDSSGEARVTLETNREAEVTARAGSQSATTRVTVGTPPTLQLVTSPANPVVGLPVTLTVTPAGGTMPRVIVNWGDGSTSDLGTIAAATNATHVYGRSGSYSILATASQDGDTFATSTSVNVGAAAVTLSEPSPASPTVGTPVTFTVTPAAGTSPRVVINWGDGNTDDLGTLSAARTVAHTYNSAGSYIVTANATSGSETFTTSRGVTVAARPGLSVNVSATPSNPDRCQPATFTAVVSPAGESITSYRWTIDSDVDSEDVEITTTGNSLTRAFTNSGTKTVTVTASTADGRTGNGQTQIVVKTTPATCP